MDKVCDRCGIGTEHFWSYKSMKEECCVCNDCLSNFVQKLINDGIIHPITIVDWAKQNVKNKA